MKTFLRSAAVLGGLTMAAAPAAAQPGAASDTQTVTTLHARDLNGAVAPAEQVVERRARTGDGEQVVLDIYEPSIEAGRLALTRRIRRTTTTTGTGSRTIEEVEERNPAAPSDPMRLVRRTVTNVRPSGSGSQVTEHQVFERDVNDRLVPIFRQVENASAR